MGTHLLIITTTMMMMMRKPAKLHSPRTKGSSAREICAAWKHLLNETLKSADETWSELREIVETQMHCKSLSVFLFENDFSILTVPTIIYALLKSFSFWTTPKHTLTCSPLISQKWDDKRWFMPRVECLQESHVNVGKSERETDKQANMPDGIET